LQFAGELQLAWQCRLRLGQRLWLTGSNGCWRQLQRDYLRVTIRTLTNAAAQQVSNGTRLGEYEVAGVLGAGGMGTVYRGVHPIIGKEVAIKVLAPHLSKDEAMVQRFVQEARAVVKIQHINIIDVFAFGHEPNVGHYFIMPLLAGESLADRMERGPMALADILPIVEQISDALDTAHESGIYHRDLKPDNIYLAAERNGPPSVRILDFGIAKLVESDMSATQTGVQMGTPLFMSPEQWEGRGVDHRTDIYALGVMVHHLMTARYPFESNSHIALMNLHVNGQPKLPSAFGADDAMDRVFAKALAKEKQYRYESANEFYLAFAAAAEASKMAEPLHTVAGPVSPLLESELEMLTRPPSSRGRLVFFGVAAGVVVALGALVFAFTSGGSTGGDSKAKPAAADDLAGDTINSDTAATPLDAEAAVTGAAVTGAAVTGAAAHAATVPPDSGPIAGATADAGAVPAKTRTAGDKPAGDKRIRASSTKTKDKPPEVKPPPKKPGDKTQWGHTVDPYQ
tara:strand:- start:919 stop:2454 length:1536 start_codon:yes stop_codon:yes gene_type:complete